MATTAEPHLALGDVAARQLANAQKTAPTMLSISPRWLVHLLSWWGFDAGLPAEQDTCEDIDALIDALIAALPRIATRSEAPNLRTGSMASATAPTRRPTSDSPHSPAVQPIVDDRFHGGASHLGNDLQADGHGVVVRSFGRCSPTSRPRSPRQNRGRRAGTRALRRRQQPRAAVRWAEWCSARFPGWRR